MGKNVWIASNVTILPGVQIGDNSIIGAGQKISCNQKAVKTRMAF
ncbi:hypothetical protein AALA36_03185 [Lachnospiraceae bacterium 66-29]